MSRVNCSKPMVATLYYSFIYSSSVRSYSLFHAFKFASVAQSLRFQLLASPISMDPVSIISIVSTCVSATVKSIKALQTIHDFYGSYNNAPNGIRYLIGDVAAAQLQLVNIQSDLNSGTLFFPKLHKTLSGAFELCMDALKGVEEFASKHQGLTSSRSDRASYTWNEKHVKRCRAELEHQIKFLKYTHETLFKSRYECPPLIVLLYRH